MLETSQDFGRWNERAGQYTILSALLQEMVAYARAGPLIRVYTGQGDEFRPLAGTGYYPWPPRAVFVPSKLFFDEANSSND